MSASSQDAGSYDVAVVGGGVVGAAIAFGLAQRDLSVAVLDEGDRALRAARANFGLVWVQSKGQGLPAYMHWTRRSADLWPAFAQQLKDLTGVATEYRKPGGLMFCVGEAEYEACGRRLEALRAQADVYDARMIGRGELERLLPGVRLGADVTGASFCPHDGDANPLLLLRALHAALPRVGAEYRPEAPARAIRRSGGEFLVDTPAGTVAAGRLVLAAGHGNSVLGPALGLQVPIHAERGQIIVTERVRGFLPLPASGIRQTADGTVMIGTSQEATGFDDRTTVPVGARMASRALRIVPELSRVKVQRTWAGIRVLSPDKHPMYVQSESHPGAFLATCHSGVTLAAVHAADLAGAVAAGELPPPLRAFHPRRFHVSATA